MLPIELHIAFDCDRRHPEGTRDLRLSRIAIDDQLGMCVTPAGKIGNCTWGMPKLLPHSRKKGSLLHLPLPKQNRSSQFLFPPICRQEGIWSFETGSGRFLPSRQQWPG